MVAGNSDKGSELFCRKLSSRICWKRRFHFLVTSCHSCWDMQYYIWFSRTCGKGGFLLLHHWIGRKGCLYPEEMTVSSRIALGWFLGLLCGFQYICSELDQPGLAKLIAAHARPPNYLTFFQFFEPPNLANKVHVEEWSPSIQQVVTIASDLGPNLLQLPIFSRDYIFWHVCCFLILE